MFRFPFGVGVAVTCHKSQGLKRKRDRGEARWQCQEATVGSDVLGGKGTGARPGGNSIREGKGATDAKFVRIGHRLLDKARGKGYRRAAMA